MLDLPASWADRIQAATASGQPLRLRGGGTKDWYGQTLEGEILDTQAFTGIIDYDPAELVFTARCGTPLVEIEATLASHGQMLPFEPPHYGPGATLGGCIAAGLAGPRRASAGAVRDFVLGAVLMDGRGQILHFGGQVMKNVAGYDVSRLLAGSLGTLGLGLQFSIKVLPRPFYETTLEFEMSATDAVRKLNEWGGNPLPISASAWHDGTLRLRLAGAEAAVRAARSTLGGELADMIESERFWESVREHTAPFFARIPEGCALWRLSLPSTTEPLPGSQFIEWGGAERWWKTDADAQAVRTAARQAGGHATLFRHGDKRVGVFTPLPAPIAKIHQALKTAFDPAHIFNRARLYPNF